MVVVVGHCRHNLQRESGDVSGEMPNRVQLLQVVVSLLHIVGVASNLLSKSTMQCHHTTDGKGRIVPSLAPSEVESDCQPRIVSDLDPLDQEIASRKSATKHPLRQLRKYLSKITHWGLTLVDRRAQRWDLNNFHSPMWVMNQVLMSHLTQQHEA